MTFSGALLRIILGFHPSFSRHGITRASSVLLIWLNENVRFYWVLK